MRGYSNADYCGLWEKSSYIQYEMMKTKQVTPCLEIIKYYTDVPLCLIRNS